MTQQSVVERLEGFLELAGESYEDELYHIAYSYAQAGLQEAIAHIRQQEARIAEQEARIAELEAERGWCNE